MTTSCPNCEARLEVDYFTTVPMYLLIHAPDARWIAEDEAL